MAEVVSNGCCAVGSICFEVIKGLPAAGVALVIGVIAAGIAYRQYLVARAKLNLDLFERRYAIFEATWGYLSSAVQGPSSSAFSSPFDNLIPQASFLFGKEMEDYLREASSKMRELRMIEMKAKARGDVIPPEDINRETELNNWFLEEARTGARKRFGKFLDFEKWR